MERTLTEIEIVCRHYLASKNSERFWGDDGMDQCWVCPSCGAQGFRIYVEEGEAGCSYCELPDSTPVPGVIATLGDYDPGTEQREINRERRTILNNHELEQYKSREHQREFDSTVDRMEQELEEERQENAECEKEQRARERAAREREKQRERDHSRRLRAEAGARHIRTVQRVRDASGVLRNAEMLIVALVFISVMLFIFYGLGWLYSLSTYAPMSEAEALGLPDGLASEIAEDSDPDTGLVEKARDAAGTLSWETLHPARILLGIGFGAIAGWYTWHKFSINRRRSAALGQHEYVGTYNLDPETGKPSGLKG